MDAKALAKSKRAHSQHHKNKLHPNQKLKAPAVTSDNAGIKEKQLGKQVGVGTRQARHISKLPSNWDRYDDDGSDLDSEGPSGATTGLASDIVVPKSKGADYLYLIAEAQSQSQSQLQSHSHSDAFPSLDDVMPGAFIQGMRSMLSVRGESILSWIGDDNFVVEDKTAAFQEASFLSLNLNALAEQLSKVELSQRLYVEADLLPSEPSPEGSMASSYQKSGHLQTEHGSEEAVVISKDVDISSGDFSEYEEESVAHKIKASEENASSDFNENYVQVKKNFSKFEAAAAEAELDMLLDSFSDTKILDSSSPKFNATSVSRQASSTAVPQPSTQGSDLTKSTPVTASFDDVLDGLLEETSNAINSKGLSQPQDIKINPHETQSSSSSTSSSQSVKKSKVLDDFDSWLDTI